MTERHFIALGLAERKKPTPKIIERVSHQVGDELARWAFTQWELRTRAKSKFAKAEDMLFDRDGLEMATHEAVAAYHASQFKEGELVADLTCGIGADLIALARRGPAIGFEIDPTRADYSLHNLSVHGLDVPVLATDALGQDWGGRINPSPGFKGSQSSLAHRPGEVGRGPSEACAQEINPAFDAAFADPARRGGGRRSVDPTDFQPNPIHLAERMKNLRLGGIKLSPMLPDSFLEGFNGKLEFISYKGECREALVWLGREAGTGRFAVHIESGDRLPSAPPPAPTDQPGAFLIEADPAAIRGHALGTLCAHHELHPLGDSNGYLTSPHPVKSPWLKTYKIVWHGKADTKTTQTQLKAERAHLTDVKTRGTKEPAEQIKMDFKPQGDRPLVLAVWPVGKSLRHTLLEPLDPNPSPDVGD